MKNRGRILSIDIMRGLTLFLMLFVNDLYVPGVPKWLVHTEAQENGMGLADWVFPGFLFMVGLSIPFAFMARRKKGDTTPQLLWHIVSRTLSLLIIGIFMVNVPGLNESLTGIPKYLWAFLAYACVFLIWNLYPKTSNPQLVRFLKLLGITGLLVLGMIYRSGSAEAPETLAPQWWGILGLIGWGYLVASLVYMLFGDHLLKIAVAWGFFIGLNVLSQLQLLNILEPLKPVLGVIIDGNVPSIVVCGLLVGILLKKYRDQPGVLLKVLIPFGILALGTGFILAQWFIVSKILGTPSWAMLCNGISILLFALLYQLIDRKGYTLWTVPFKPAGQNSLTTYLAPDMLYYIIWGFSLPILFYKQSESSLLAVTGSLVWALAMVGFAALLSKINIRLKL